MTIRVDVWSERGNTKLSLSSAITVSKQNTELTDYRNASGSQQLKYVGKLLQVFGEHFECSTEGPEWLYDDEP